MNPLISFTGEREVWSDDDDIDANDLPLAVNESPPSSPCEARTHSTNTVPSIFTQWLLAFFLLLQAHFRLADRVMNFIFVFLKTFFLVLGRSYAPFASVGTDLPTTFYMAKKSYSGLCHIKFQKMPVCK